jgi:hypothetical protein
MLDDPDIEDQFAFPYPLGTALKIPAVNEDPGRIRNGALYGDCRKGEVTKRLKPVTWLPDRGGETVLVTTVNGVADRLADVARSLATLPRSKSWIFSSAQASSGAASGITATPSTLNTVPRSLRSPSKAGREIRGCWPSRPGLLLPRLRGGMA